MTNFRNRYGILILSCLICIRGPSSTCHAQILEIKPGDALQYSDELVSAGGVFTLGFFSLTSSSDLGYLGIWYTKEQYDRKVWIGNRNNSISNSKGSLSMDVDGILKIMDGDGLNPIVLNSAPDRAAKNSRATLTDTGNFVLEELNDDGTTKRVLWQSFDHPVDTLLPGMKLGVNFTTGETWTLTSRISEEVAAPGAFSLEWDWEKAQLVMRRRGEVYWTSGAMDGEKKRFANMPGLYTGNPPSDYSFSHVSNEESNYFYYAVTTDRISWWNLGIEGSFWDSTLPIFVVPNACYGYDKGVIPGCVEQKSEECRVLKGGGTDKFYPQRGSFMGGSDAWSNDSVSIGISDCWASCWNNCSCIAYSSNDVNGTGCIFWGIGSIFVPSESTSVGDIFVLDSVLNKSNNAKKWWIWIIIPLVAVLVALILGWLFYIRRRKLREAREKYEEEILIELTTSKRFTDSKEIGDGGNKGREVKLFSFASILAAKNNFSSENKLGQGGFGPVYKGTLPDG